MPIAIPDLFQTRGQGVTNYLLSHRVLLYTLTSTIATSATIVHALQNHSNFYSVAVYLSKSGRSVLILVNFALLIALACARIVQQIFFGELRPLEVERLYDRMWFFVTESLLAFTIFRDEFDIPFGVMFLFLLFVKSFHWLMADRVEWMNQMPYPGPSTLFHLRVQALFAVLYLTDAIMILFAAESVFANGVGAIVLFASEYAILSSSALNAMTKYLLSAYELRRAASRGGENAPPWENKSMYIFYIDLATDFAKLVTYLAFFAIVITFYGVPLNVIRDVYVTARSFITRLRDLMRYRAATRNMDERYPNATEQEMSSMSDRTCIICREEMVARDAGTQQPTPVLSPDGPNMTPKKLPCGHIFHFHCLRSWLERQQSCPTCRRGVLDATPTTQAPRAEDARAAAPPGNNAFAPRGDPQQQGAQPRNFLRNLLGIPLVPQQRLPQAAQPQGPLQPPPFFAGAPPFQPGWVPQPPQPQGPLQPPPVWHGFHGPGGVWQPWPGAQQPQAANNAQPPAAEASATDSTPSSQPSASQPPGSPLHPPDGASTAPNPREAAAAAAMRRFGGSSSSTGAPAPQPPAASSSKPEGSSTGNTNTSQSSELPALIPMYDLTPRVRAPSQYFPGHIGGNSNPTARPQTQLSAPWLLQGRPSVATLTPNRSDPRLVARAQARPPLASLPPTLTEEELTRLDRLTRDAIDERLRILENVSIALHRSMEELTRVRSVLPPLPASSQPSVTTTSQPSQSANVAERAPEPAPSTTLSAAPTKESTTDNSSDASSSHSSPKAGVIPLE